MGQQPSRIGPYLVERELGRGGMGVVYLARDGRLDRPAALKALPEEFARDPERRARFEREARVLASLNHPGVAGIYGLEEVDGGLYLALEYVEGEALSERLERGPMSIEEAVELAAQIASGLEAAHEAGVIHRDLKPGNVVLTPDGLAKILDFGLAKAIGIDVPSGSAPNLTQSPTMAQGQTQDGMVIGTAAYMSPEQARGRRVDRRADLWAFGCLLYEMVSGRQAFRGETISDTLAAVLRGEPDWSALPAQTPQGLRRLMRRCLEKDPKNRLRDAHDARLDLAESLREPAGELPASPAAATGGRLLRIATAGGAFALLGLLAGWLAWGFAGRGGDPPVARLAISIPDAIQCGAAVASPDLSAFALLGRPRPAPGETAEPPQIYLRRLDSYDASPMKGTERVVSAAFSGDGKWLAYAAPVSQDDSAKLRLFKVPVDGSAPPVGLADWANSWSPPVWMPDGGILITTGEGKSLAVIRPGSGGPSPFMKIDLGQDVESVDATELLPGGRTFLADVISYGPRGFQAGVAAVDVATGRGHFLEEDGGSPRYLPPSHLLFTRHDTLLAVPFDAVSHTVRGEAVAVLGGLRTFNSWAPAPFSVSAGGALSYLPGGTVGARRRIAYLSRSGQVEPWSEDARPYSLDVALSPDGRRLATEITNGEGIDEIFVSDVSRPSLRRLVAVPKTDVGWLAWSPGGDRLAFMRRGGDEKDGVYVVRADGAGGPELVFRCSQEVAYQPCAWTPDGRSIMAMQVSRREQSQTMVMLSVVPDGKEPRPILRTGSGSAEPAFSPDGRWLAYTSAEMGSKDVYISRWDPSGRLGPAITVSARGGVRPMWSADGKSLSYVDPQGRILSARLQFEPDVSVAGTDPGPDIVTARACNVPRGLGLAPDGRFLFCQMDPGEGEVRQIDVVANWSEELRTKLAAAKR